MWLASAFFALCFLVPVLQDNFGWIWNAVKRRA